jgi:endonuclease/exonuclease/phosphatase family metal-dependent hydrolase
MTCRYRHKHTFTKSRSMSLKGVEATLWDVPKWGNGNKRLLVFNTHLDPWHVNNRRQQVREILAFVGQTLQNIERKIPTTSHQDWSNTGVLILGDFNIKADSKEYLDTLQSNQGWVDYFQGETQHTYAEENSLVCYSEDCGRIDYIFGLHYYKTKYCFLPLTVVSRSIRKEPVGKESSDHYALEIELVPNK